MLNRLEKLKLELSTCSSSTNIIGFITELVEIVEDHIKSTKTLTGSEVVKYYNEYYNKIGAK